jgi:hypothetical protein
MAGEYYNDDKVNLHFKDAKDCSLDEFGAEKLLKDKSKANTPGTYVQQLQKDLILLGYLPEKDAQGAEMADGYCGRSTGRAITRFQRHAARVYRMDSGKTAQDVEASAVFKGQETGVCDAATAKEIRNWIDKKWMNPVGRFALVGIAGEAGTKLRSDAAKAWEAIMKKVEEKGGSLKGPYGNTFRPLAEGGGQAGSSKWSVHHSGRAVDINQDGKKIVKDPSNGRMYWRVFQKTAKQDGTQGTKIEKGALKAYDHKSNKESDMAAGYYLELTVEIQDGGGFVRIPAQKSWDDRADYEGAADEEKAKKYRGLYNKQEWWHFQYAKDMQATFIDELELIGFSEVEVRKVKDGNGVVKWPTDNDLDVKPG